MTPSRESAAAESKQVTVCECWLRDGLQGWPGTVTTADKLRLARAVAESGVPELDVTSFIPPSTTPQFGDAVEVLREFPEGPAVRVLTVNLIGVRRVVAARREGLRIDSCGFPLSVSESHNRANLRASHAEQQQLITAMVPELLSAGISPLLGLATAFGCPIEGRVPFDRVLALAGWGRDLGIRRMMLGDTTGMADPVVAHARWRRVLEEFPDVEWVAHFHDTRGWGIANTLAALAAGVTTVDTSLGGIGGEPRTVEQNHAGESGNTCTEDLVTLLDQVGVETDIDLELLLRAGELSEEILGQRLRSQVLRTGPAFQSRRV